MIVHLEGSLAATYRNKIYDEFFSSILIITYVLLISIDRWGRKWRIPLEIREEHGYNYKHAMELV